MEQESPTEIEQIDSTEQQEDECPPEEHAEKSIQQQIEDAYNDYSSKAGKNGPTPEFILSLIQ